MNRSETEAGSPIADRWAHVDGDCKSAIRDALIRDQDGLCVYCGGRLTDKMKVEHFVPRSADPDLILEWANLLGCCSGVYREGNTKVTHCDSHRTPYAHDPPSPPKGLLNIHPVQSVSDPALSFHIRVHGKELGWIDIKTPEAKHDLDELNLNADFLVKNRRHEIIKLRKEFSKLSGDVPVAVLERKYRAATTPTADGLPPYAHVVAKYLKSKLNRAK